METTDTIGLIVEYLFTGTKIKNANLLNNVYKVFGRSKRYKSFVQQAKTYFFEELFLKHKVSTLDALIKIFIKRGTPYNFPVYTRFRKEKDKPSLYFPSLDRRTKLIVRYVALYNDYTHTILSSDQFEGHGYCYADIHFNAKYEGSDFTYAFLKRKRIHNLDYYDLIIKTKNPNDCVYRLKPCDRREGIAKAAATVDYHEVMCIKI